MSRNVDASKGTKTWKAKHYREKVLPALMKDILELQSQGLEDNYCQLVQNSLQKYAESTSNVPVIFSDPESLSSISHKFFRAYFEWNAINGSELEHISSRRRYFGDLKKLRDRIANVDRYLRPEIEQYLDASTLNDGYKYIGELLDIVPVKKFENLQKVYRDYAKFTTNKA